MLHSPPLTLCYLSTISVYYKNIKFLSWQLSHYTGSSLSAPSYASSHHFHAFFTSLRRPSITRFSCFICLRYSSINFWYSLWSWLKRSPDLKSTTSFLVLCFPVVKHQYIQREFSLWFLRFLDYFILIINNPLRKIYMLFLSLDCFHKYLVFLFIFLT